MKKTAGANSNSGQLTASMAAIRKFAREVARRFQPDKIILFGSYAYGTPSADSDVDILVVMPARNQHDQAVKIRWEVPRSFPLDLIVRTPKNLAWRLTAGESFHTEIVNKGRVLYEADKALKCRVHEFHEMHAGAPVVNR